MIVKIIWSSAMVMVMFLHEITNYSSDRVPTITIIIYLPFIRPLFIDLPSAFTPASNPKKEHKKIKQFKDIFRSLSENEYNSEI